MGTNSCRGTLAIALRTRWSSAVLPAWAAMWALVALIAATMSRLCFSKYSAFMKRLNSTDTQICDTVNPRRHFLMAATDDGERVAGLRKQMADPTQDDFVCDKQGQPARPTSMQHNNLLSQYQDLGFQRCS